MSHRTVVVGHGMVGARFVAEVRRCDPDGARATVTVFGAERHAAYNRVLLSSVLAGGLSADQVWPHQPGWAVEHRVRLNAGVRVTGIDRGDRRLLLADGASEPYDELSRATRAGTGRGGCRAGVLGIQEWLAAAEPHGHAEGAGAA